jgi:hypothetical protein
LTSSVVSPFGSTTTLTDAPMSVCAKHGVASSNHAS